tara:strand:- start:11860 stop:12216 length:357 start_codon:yes stop_codon:yes gene_type:complete
MTVYSSGIAIIAALVAFGVGAFSGYDMNAVNSKVCEEGRPFLSTIADFGSGVDAWTEIVPYAQFVSRLGFEPWDEPADIVGIMSGEFGAVAYSLHSNACYKDFMALTKEHAAQIAGRE